MTKRAQIIAALLLAVALLSAGAYSYFTDSVTVSTRFQAASLKLGTVTTNPLTLGENLKPGDTGTFVVNVPNVGTIPGRYTVTLKGDTGYLRFIETQQSGEVAAGATVPVVFHWNIPEDADLGTGGQNVEIKIAVDLEQIHP
ncbi:MAG TPA: TasA family protein [Patescibacteria group bacterium]